MSVFVCQIKFFFESQGVYIGVWVLVSTVLWVRLSHMDTIRVSSEHDLRVQDKVPKTTHQCVD